jgi:histidyl-tRNA synthetase
LTGYFERHLDELDADSHKRLTRNPMRILDSKNPGMATVIAAAPLLTDYLDQESQVHFSMLCDLLDDAGIAYRLNPRLVRGLDYYSRTVFEWVTDRLGSQGAVCSGGRYDGLVEQLGGRPTPAIGWAIGMERLLELYQLSGGSAAADSPNVYVVAVGEGVLRPAVQLTEKLRDARPGLKVEMHCGGGGFKSQMKRADRSGAAIALILGDEELASQTVGIKALRATTPQVTVGWTGLPEALDRLLAGEGQPN